MPLLFYLATFFCISIFIFQQQTKGEPDVAWDIVQFHPSYGYEDFIRGIKVSTKPGSDTILYETVNKVLGNIAELAKKHKKTKFFLIIDEINRANLATVFGELIYGLEYRTEPVATPYSVNNNNRISMPDNLYIIGTMNTADKSIGGIDYAIRRRFLFFEQLPDVKVSGTACNGLKFSGCYTYYKPVMAMARMVLDDISVESNGEISTTGYIVPYAISMEKLFEVYVRAYLKKNGIESYRSKSDKGIRLEKYDNKTDVFMEEEGLSNPGKYISGSIKPDLILTDRESGETVVFDVKYKDYTNGDSRNDRLQLLAYSMMMNANNVGIILPAQAEMEIFDARRINSMENRTVKYHQMLLGMMKDNPTIANYIKDNTFEKKD